VFAQLPTKVNVTITLLTALNIVVLLINLYILRFFLYTLIIFLYLKHHHLFLKMQLLKMILLLYMHLQNRLRDFSLSSIIICLKILHKDMQLYLLFSLCVKEERKEDIYLLYLQYVSFFIRLKIKVSNINYRSLLIFNKIYKRPSFLYLLFQNNLLCFTFVLNLLCYLQ
jgi:hypothetical protein